MAKDIRKINIKNVQKYLLKFNYTNKLLRS